MFFFDYIKTTKFFSVPLIKKSINYLKLNVKNICEIRKRICASRLFIFSHYIFQEKNAYKTPDMAINAFFVKIANY